MYRVHTRTYPNRQERTRQWLTNPSASADIYCGGTPPAAAGRIASVASHGSKCGPRPATMLRFLNLYKWLICLTPYAPSAKMVTSDEIQPLTDGDCAKPPACVDGLHDYT